MQGLAGCLEKAGFYKTARSADARRNRRAYKISSKISEKISESQKPEKGQKTRRKTIIICEVDLKLTFSA
jgi:hypothetical protein